MFQAKQWSKVAMCLHKADFYTIISFRAFTCSFFLYCLHCVQFSRCKQRHNSDMEFNKLDQKFSRYHEKKEWSSIFRLYIRRFQVHYPNIFFANISDELLIEKPWLCYRHKALFLVLLLYFCYLWKINLKLFLRKV